MPLAAPLLGTAYAPSSNASSHALNVPAGTTAGQRMLAILVASNGNTNFAPVEAGWNEIYQNFDGTTATSGGTKLVIYERTVTGSEPGSYTFTTASRTVVGQIIAYPGSDGMVSTTTSVTRYGTATTTPTAPSLDPTPYTQARLLYIGVARAGVAGDAVVDRTPPGTMTERSDVENGGASVAHAAFLLADEQLSVSGATGTRVGGFASPGSRGFAAALLVYPDDEDVNNDPVADAGADQTGNVGDLITLDGSNSSDVEGISSYAWTQLSGPTVTLSGANSAIATFTPTEASNYSFRLTITDTNSVTDTDDVLATIYPTGVGVGATNSATSSSISAVIPADAVVGEVAFLVLSRQAPVTLTPPAGWLSTVGARSGTSSSHAYVQVFYKRLVLGEPGSTVNAVLSQNAQWAAVIITVSGLHALHPVLRSMYKAELEIPDIDGLVVNGTPGTTTYEYVATAIDEAGETRASDPVAITTGPDTLSGSDYIRVWFNPIPGATNYRVYGRTAGGPYQLIATVDNTNISGVSTNQKRGINDTGTATIAQAPPSAYPNVIHWDCRDADNPARLRTNFANGYALHAAALRMGAATPGFAVTSNPANSMILAQHLHGSNQQLLAVVFEELGPAGDLLSGRLGNFNASTEAWAGTSIILRPAAANGPPTAIAGADRTEFAGTKVYLDATIAYDIDEDNLTYAWVQTVGPAVTLNDANTVHPWFIAPSSPASLTFQVTVTDPSSLADTAETVITVVAAPSVVHVYDGGIFNSIQVKAYKSGNWV